jgi:hypothetical protein
MKVLEGLDNYNGMVADSLMVLRTIYTKFDVAVTNMFTPLSNVIGVMFNCKVVLIDAIPNRLFYHNNREIATNLPITISETGNLMRYAILEEIDKNRAGVNQTNTNVIEVVTCHKSLYEGLIDTSRRSSPYNVLTNDKVTSNRRKELVLNNAKRNMLITFGSIPCESRIRELLLVSKEGWELHFSGYGNNHVLQEQRSYHPELNYPEDLKRFDLVLHHGGIGTTWNCIKAKVRQLIWPIFGDQHIWASFVRIKQVGEMVTNIDGVMNQLQAIESQSFMEMQRSQRSCEELLRPYLDDTNTVLEKLSLVKVDKSVYNKKTISSQGQQMFKCETVMEAVGEAEGIEDVFNPSTIDHCSWMCVTKVMELTKSQKSLNWKNPNIQELKQNLRHNNINYALILQSDNVDILITDVNGPSIILQIVQGEASLHCKLVNAKINVRQVSQITNITHSDALPIGVMNEVAELGSQVVDLVVNAGKARSDLMEKYAYMKVNLEARLERQSTPLRTIKLLRVEDAIGVYMTTGAQKLQTDCLYFCDSTLSDEYIVFYTIVMRDRAFD